MSPHQTFLTMQKTQTKAISAAVEAWFFLAFVTGGGHTIIATSIDPMKLIKKVIAK